MNQVGLFTLICVLVTANYQVCVEADQSCDKWSCDFYLTNRDIARLQFTKIDHNKIWLVYFNLTTENSKAPVYGESGTLAWAHNHASPFLSFDESFEVFSFSMLSQSVTVINIQAKSVGPDPSRDCLKYLQRYCRIRLIAKALLNKITDKRGAVCSPNCCEYRGGDVECDIGPGSGWLWMCYFSTIIGIAGYFFFPLLLYLLPSTPEPLDEIELTSPQDPSPLSLTNVFVKCFSNKPEPCFRDALKRLCCRAFVLLGLIPLILYLYTITFLSLRHKIFLVKDPVILLFQRLGFIEAAYYTYAIFALALVFAPLLQLFSTHGRHHRGNEILLNYWSDLGELSHLPMKHKNFIVCMKRGFRKTYVNMKAFLWGTAPLCCQENRNIINIYQIPTYCFCVVGPCVFFIFYGLFLAAVWGLSPLVAIGAYPLHCLIHTVSNDNVFVRLVAFFCAIVAVTLLCTIITSAVLLPSFVIYTLIGFVLNYKVYLPLVSVIILVINCTYRSYHTTNESYDGLRKLVFEVCNDQQQELDNSRENLDDIRLQQPWSVQQQQQQQQEQQRQKQQQQQQQGEHQPLLEEQRRQQCGRPGSCLSAIPRKLIYTDAYDGSPRIPKRLFENICWKLKPTGTMFLVMLARMAIQITFLMMIVVAVFTLTPRTGFGTVTQAAVTLFVGSLPQVVSVFSNNNAKAELQQLEMTKCIQHSVKQYIEKGELTELQFLEQEHEQQLELLIDP